MGEAETVVKRRSKTINIVVAALFAGIMVVLAQFGLYVGGYLGSFFPAVVVYTVAGIWFGLWGWGATVVGIGIGDFLGGYPIFIVAVLVGIDVVKSAITTVPFKVTNTDPSLRTKKSWGIWVVFMLISMLVGGLMLAYAAVYLLGWYPHSLYWVAFGGMAGSDIILNITIGTALLLAVTPAIKRTRIYVNKWL